MGFPAGSYIGFASTSILEVAIPGKSAPEGRGVPFLASFLVGAAFATTSVELVRCAIFRISLYFGCLILYQPCTLPMRGKPTMEGPVSLRLFSQ